MVKESELGHEVTSKFSVLSVSGESDAKSSNKGSGSSSGGVQGRRTIQSSGPKMESDGTLLGKDSFVKRQANPSWLEERVKIFDEIDAKRKEEMSSKTPTAISVTMPDGNVLEKDKQGEPFMSWKTTPFMVAATISQGLADNSTVARVTFQDFVADYDLGQDGMAVPDAMAEALGDEVEAGSSNSKVYLWDINRPLVGNVSKLELLKFDSDEEAKTVFWHSSAHIMGEALENLYGNQLTIGPPLNNGFYYDSYMGSDSIKEDDCTFK